MAATPPGGKISLLGSSGGGGMASITGSGGISGFSSASSSSGGYGSSSGGYSTSSSGGGFGGSSSGFGSSSGSGLNNQASDNSPQINLFSNGDTNTFALTIARVGVGRSATLQSANDGSVQVGDIVEVKQ